VLNEIQVDIQHRTRSNTPSPVGACGPLSTWLCIAATDVSHVVKDEDNVKEMRRKLDEVVVEFDVRRPRESCNNGTILKDLVLSPGGLAYANGAQSGERGESREARHCQHFSDPGPNAS
jgi:hypothetical protein